MISFAKVTKSAYNALTPVQDRIYYIEDTGEQYLNGKPYVGDDGTRDWLCFTANEASSTVALNKIDSPNEFVLEYSTDGINWTNYTWNGTAGATVTLANVGDKVYFRGDNNVPTCVYENDTEKYYQFSMTGSISASGNIMSLLDKSCQRKDIPQTNSRGFAHLFSGCPITTPPILPATTLSNYCYDNMFYQCASLEVAPDLPATTLANYCYNAMFSGCTSLRVAPALPAMIMADGCYRRMFMACTSLVETMADLPATCASYECYRQMFAGCGIRATPKIRLVNTAEGCMRSMFSGCTNLKVACDLDIVDTTSYCCYEMFFDCQTMDTGPSVLRPTYVASYAYSKMFNHCDALRNAPELMFKEVTGDYACQYMFRNCGKIAKIRAWLNDWNSTAYPNAFKNWLQSTYSYGVFEGAFLTFEPVFGNNNIPTYWVPVLFNNTDTEYSTSANVQRRRTYNPLLVMCPSSEIHYYYTATTDFTFNVTSYTTNNNAYVCYANFTLQINDGVTVTAGSNITFVDSLTANKINHCVIRWEKGVAKLYVVDTEDIPA